MDPRRSSRRSPLLATLALTTLLTTAGAASPTGGANGFAFDLYGQLRAADGNLFLSPFSVRTALAMTLAGARGETATELGAALRLDAGDDAAHAALGASLRALSSDPASGVELAVANRLWGERSYGFLPGFLERLEEVYGAGLERVDFRGDADGSRRAINDWVEAATEGRIEDLLPPGAVRADTRLAIVNAVHFLGLWAHPFDASRTEEAPFDLAAGGTVEAPFMTHDEPQRLLLYAGDGFQAIELPYQGDGFSLVVLLPDAPDGLPDLEARLDPALLDRVTGGMRPGRVEVWLPRFEVTWGTVDLAPALAALGVRDLFLAGAADLSGIDGTRDLFVGGVFHQAFVRVGEEGTEAAAATGVVIGITSAPPTPVATFRADRPFLFLIRDTSSGDVLFLGRLVDPTRP